MSRRFLVMARAGDRSLHRHWLAGGPRNFDLYLSCYGKDPSIHEGTAEHIRPMGSTKWPAIHAHLLEDADIVRRYDAIWFPDDDVLADAPTIGRMFEIFSLFGLGLAQPALTWNSHHTHSLVLRQPGYLLRRTNFVEVMAPVFDRNALALLSPTFSQVKVGWGLDYLWPVLMEQACLGDKIAVIDETPVTHTRPVGSGDIYRGIEEGGEADIHALRRLYPGAEFSTRKVVRRFAVHGGVRKSHSPGHLVSMLTARIHQWFARRRSCQVSRFDLSTLSAPSPSSKGDRPIDSPG